MSTSKESKLNTLLNSHPAGVVLLSAWMVDQGYSLDLQKRYKHSQWFESIGTGAMIRKNDQIDYLGAVYALQTQRGLNIHPGAKTALSLLGKSHYLELSAQKAILFGGADEQLPLWFKQYDWGLEIDLRKSSFLPPDLGLVEIERKTFKVKISSPARAILECLYLAPDKQPLLEVMELMEGLNNLRPTTVQALLEACQSVKVKRLFLYLAEKSKHEWFHHLDLSKIDLGRGKRSLVKNGVYIADYQITVPKELED